MVHVRLTFLASLALASLPHGLAGASEPGAPLRIRCTPSSVELPGSGLRSAANPIAQALAEATPGSVIELDPGNYPPFQIGFASNDSANAGAAGGTAGNPVTVIGFGEVRVVGSAGDTIAVNQEAPNGHITFRNLIIVPGERAGLMFYRQGGGKVHRGYTFEDCHVLGRFSHPRGTGRRSKWGVWAHSLADFTFAGRSAPAQIENISEEHAFYIQNTRGRITIENVEARDLGRTFCQFTGRAAEGDPSSGDVIIRRCVVEDIGLSAGDAFKGGAAFTFAGRWTGTILVEECSYRAGFRRAQRALTRDGAPYGTGALAAWEGGEVGPNGALILRDNEFVFSRGTGDRPVVAIGGCSKALVVGRNKFVSGGDQPALAIDPVDDDGNPISRKNGSVYLAPMTELTGGLTVGGKAPSKRQRAALERALPG